MSDLTSSKSIHPNRCYMSSAPLQGLDLTRLCLFPKRRPC
jgi:hypothetical protein